MSNGESQKQYAHFNVFPNSGKTDQWIVNEPLVHEIATHQIITTSMELILLHHQMKGTFQCIYKSLHHLVGKSVHSRPILHT